MGSLNIKKNLKYLRKMPAVKLNLRHSFHMIEILSLKYISYPVSLTAKETAHSYYDNCEMHINIKLIKIYKVPHDRSANASSLL